MKLDDITVEVLKKIKIKELLNLHIRLHQLYSLAEIRNNNELMKKFYKLHSLIVVEMEERDIRHSSPLNLKIVRGLQI